MKKDLKLDSSLGLGMVASNEMSEVELTEMHLGDHIAMVKWFDSQIMILEDTLIEDFVAVIKSRAVLGVDYSVP